MAYLLSQARSPIEIKTSNLYCTRQVHNSLKSFGFAAASILAAFSFQLSQSAFRQSAKSLFFVITNALLFVIELLSTLMMGFDVLRSVV
jgi:diacylglycerol kinase